MKQFILCSTLLLVFAFAYTQEGERQEGPPKPPPIAERWKHDSTTIASSIMLSADQAKKVRVAFYSFYKSMDALVEKDKSERPPREEVEKLIDQRNTGIKSVLNKAQQEQFELMKKELMPPPPHHKQGPPPGQEKR